VPFRVQKTPSLADAPIDRGQWRRAEYVLRLQFAGFFAELIAVRRKRLRQQLAGRCAERRSADFGPREPAHDDYRSIDKLHRSNRQASYSERPDSFSIRVTSYRHLEEMRLPRMGAVKFVDLDEGNGQRQSEINGFEPARR
jgi:hypothetical protein